MPEPAVKIFRVEDHVIYEYKGRRSYGIVRGLGCGTFGEARAEVEWVSGNGSPFAVCLDALMPDVDGVVEGIIGSRSSA